MKKVRVAVGVLKNTHGDILLSKRDNAVHMGGRWEFPGGKVELGETVVSALLRELSEELALNFPSELIQQALQGFDQKNISLDGDTVVSPLIDIEYAYPEKTVELCVYTILLSDDWMPSTLLEQSFSGFGAEQQPVRWVRPEDIHSFRFPDANYPILKAIVLPTLLPISKSFASLRELREQALLLKGYGLFLLRSPQLEQKSYEEFVERLVEDGVDEHQVIVSCDYMTYLRLACKNLHLNSARLVECSDLPVFKVKPGGFLSASCHNLEELKLAQKLDVDFVFYSSVLETQTHPGAAAVGWDALKHFCRVAKVPVYALGGLSKSDEQKAIESGAQGVAGIRCFQSE